MTDFRKLLEESVSDAYQRQGGTDYSATAEIRDRIFRRGRRRRTARVAGSLALVAALAGVAWASVSALGGGSERIAPADVPRLGADRVMKFGGPMAGDAGSLWVANGRISDDPGNQSVARLDLGTEKVIDGPPAIKPYGALNAAIGSSGLWLVGWEGDMPVGGEGSPVRGAITLVDPDSLEVLREIPREDSAPYDVAVGEFEGHEVAWVVDSGRHELLRVDADSGVTEAISVPPRPTSVAVGAGFVWVGSSRKDGSHVTRFSPNDGSLVEFPVDECATDVTVAAESVWVPDFCKGAVHRLDVADGSELATIEVGEEPRGLVVADELVWVLTRDDVVRIDPSTNSIVGERVVVGEHSDYITAAEDTVFVSSWDGVYRLGPDAPALERSPTPTPDDQDENESRACPSEGVECVPLDRETSLVTAGFGSAWVANLGEGETFGIARFDGETVDETARLRTDGFVLAFAHDDRWMWALLGSEPDDLTVLKIDPDDNEIVDTFEVGPAGNIGEPSLAADGTFVWVSGPNGSLTRLHRDNHTRAEGSYADQLPGYSKDNGPLKLAYGEDLLWVSYGSGNVGVIDPQTMELIRVDEGALEVNAYDILVANGFVWSSHQSPNGDAVVSYSSTDGSADRRGTVTLPNNGYPDAQALGDGLLWVVNQAFEQGDPSSLLTVDPETQELVGDPIELDIFFKGTIAAGDGYVFVTGNEVLYRITP
jgi:DNA-binding beta-propeller fold protein YncE